MRIFLFCIIVVTLKYNTIGQMFLRMINTSVQYKFILHKGVSHLHGFYTPRVQQGGGHSGRNHQPFDRLCF
jgi:hypothetical protein